MTITNADVLKAINDCLETRWEPAAKRMDGHLQASAPRCQLCALFISGVCTGCPIYVYTGKRCDEYGTTFDEWRYNPTKQKAIAMRDELIATRKYFFGE